MKPTLPLRWFLDARSGARGSFGIVAFAVLVMGAACGTKTGNTLPFTEDAGVADGGGLGDGGGLADGGGGTDGGGSGDGGFLFDGGPVDPARDTDCDGLLDVEELSTIYAGRLRTDPGNPDTDGDGILDGVEVGRTASPDPLCTGFVGAATPPTITNPTAADSDADGVSDGVEDANRNGRVDPGEMDPTLRDSDHDTVPDNADQCPLASGPPSNNGCPLPTPDGGGTTRVDTDGDGLPDDDERNIYGTDPTLRDTDGDGLSDGDEVRVHLTNPRRVDTDCDGLTDGQEIERGTNPLNPDSDGDGLADGLEVGVTTNPDPTNCPNVKLDRCPSTMTNPMLGDTDGDTCSDGVEDANQDGCVDAADAGIAAERDPNDAQDCGAVQQAACSSQNLRPITFVPDSTNNVQIAHVPSFAESTELLVAGARVGRLLYDAAGGVAAFALSKVPAGADALAEETSGRTAFESVGAVGAPTAQTFMTWDGLAARIASYDWSGATELKSKVNAVVAALLGNPSGLTGTFSDTTSAVGPHKVRVEYVRRSATQAIVVGAVAASSGFDALRDIRLQDIANGTALADGFDQNSVQCDRFSSSARPQVDFVWVIDNSGSMGDDQTALSAAAQTMATQLDTANIDWRIAVAYTDSDRANLRATCSGAPGPGKGVICPFTTDISLFRNGSAECAYTRAGTCGSGSERIFAGAQAALQAFLNGTGCETVTNGSCSFRSDAQVVVIFFSDTGEQTSSNPPGRSGTTVADWVAYFNNFNQGAGGVMRRALVSGIVCPSRTLIVRDGGTDGPCTDNLTSLPAYDRLSQFLSAVGGVEGSIRASDQAQLPATIGRILSSVIGAVSQYRLTKPPISASLKVARQLSDGGVTEVARDPATGFDYDGVSNTITLFGPSIPDAPNREIAVSYRYWVDRSAPPGMQCPPCTAPLTCNPATGACECPLDCGAPRPSLRHVCEPTMCQWTCAGDCNGQCTQYQSCATDTCSCNCLPSVTCAPGYRFNGALCDCVCDQEALACDQSRFDIDLEACTCRCKADCGGCSPTSPCNLAMCRCVPR